MGRRFHRYGRRRTGANAHALALQPPVVVDAGRPAPVIRLEEVGYRYPSGTVAVDSVSASVEAGEFVCLVGESGAGKTTLLKLIYGALPASAGRIWVDGESLHGASSRRLARVRHRFGFVFQDYALLPRLSAIENVRFPLQTTDIWMSFQQATRLAQEALEAVGLEDNAGSFPSQLSGGQQQRLAIARAIVSRPRVLLADEPTGNLDERNGRRIVALLEAVARRGTAVVVATHDPVLRLRNYRRLTLIKGRLLEDEQVRGFAWRGA